MTNFKIQNANGTSKKEIKYDNACNGNKSWQKSENEGKAVVDSDIKTDNN